MKKAVLYLVKVCISGLLAFVILTGFCMLYCNVPVHSANADGATDYVWEPNKFYSKGTEGFAWGKTNNEGYFNAFDYSEGQNIDILTMGSSHMEASNVAQNESISFVLGTLLPNYTVYNIGTSGHTFLTCADNLAAAVKKYAPTRYVLIETSTLFYTDEQLLSAIKEDVSDIPSHSKGIIGALQKNPFLRQTYSQLKEFGGNLGTNNTTKTQPKLGNVTLYSELLEKLSKTVASTGAHLIIVYHPQLLLNEDATVSVKSDDVVVDLFASQCEQINITFLDMTKPFVDNYKASRTFPHGFSNSSIGSGHLNKNGHKIIADTVYQQIKKEEE